jgi:Excreted virulence factor EspC, type VII ESX diderm
MMNKTRNTDANTPTTGDKKTPDQGGHGQLNVNPADLNNVADQYAELAARATAISPQAVVEVQRITATHGAMGHPVAVGIATSLARRQSAVEAKAAQFGVYSDRFNEHAAAYMTGDADGAAMISGIDFDSATAAPHVTSA